MTRFIFWGLVATVLLSPLPFGAMYPWAYYLIAIVVGLLVLAWSVSLVASSRNPPVTPGMIWGPAVLYIGVLLWAIVQTSPLTPTAWHNPIWSEVAPLLGDDLRGAISVNPGAAWPAIVRLLSYLGIFWLAMQYGRSGSRAKNIFHAVAIAGFVYASYGLLVEFTGMRRVLWFDKLNYLDSLTSTFTYKNAYATYAGLGLIATVALIFREIEREDFTTMGPRARAHAVLTLLFDRAWYLVLGFVFILSALVLSDSRGAILAAPASLVAFVFALRLSSARKTPYGRGFLVAMVLLSALYISISGGTIFDRFAITTGTNELRYPLYLATLDAIALHPLTGWGFGAFADVYAMFMGPEIDARVLRAHNEYLDNALGLGIPATCALVAAIAWVGILCFRGTLRRNRNQVYPAAGFAAVVLIGIHSAFDFTMQFPAVAATFALLLGAGCGQSWSSLVRRIAQAED